MARSTSSSALRPRGWWAAAALSLLAAGPARAQTDAAAACRALSSLVGGPCSVAVQAAAAAQSQVGFLVAGGNPTPGAASPGGLRLGVLPRLDASLGVTLVDGALPDLRSLRVEPTDATSYREVGVALPSLSGALTVVALPGATLGPTLRGVGSLDVLATASWLPLTHLADGRFRGSAEFAYGAGARLGLIGESFATPGASVSLTYRRLGRVSYGRICPSGTVTSSASADGRTTEHGQCLPADLGDLGEFDADLRSWSTRVTVGKHFRGLGVAGGAGYDRLASDLDVGARSPGGDFGLPDYEFVRFRDRELRQGQWSAFLDGSYSVLVTTFALELGWLAGHDAVQGYPADVSDFDPGRGRLFGSAGVRIAF